MAEYTKQMEPPLKIATDERLMLHMCRRCDEQVLMLAIDEAAVLTQAESPAVSHLIKAGILHSKRAEDDASLVCLKSLSQNERLLLALSHETLH